MRVALLAFDEKQESSCICLSKTCTMGFKFLHQGHGSPAPGKPKFLPLGKEETTEDALKKRFFR